MCQELINFPALCSELFLGTCCSQKASYLKLALKFLNYPSYWRHLTAMKALRSIVTSDLRLKYVAFVDKVPDIDQTNCHRHWIPGPRCHTNFLGASFASTALEVSSSRWVSRSKWPVLGSAPPGGQTWWEYTKTPQRYFVMLVPSTYPSPILTKPWKAKQTRPTQEAGRPQVPPVGQATSCWCCGRDVLLTLLPPPTPS